MCIVSNWVNEAQDFITVTKYDDLPNSLIPTADCSLVFVSYNIMAGVCRCDGPAAALH